MIDLKNRMFNSKTGTHHEEHMINIDYYMVMAERILRNYIDYVDNVYYIKGRREPLMDRRRIDKYIATGLAGKTPWHPVIVVPILEDFMELYQYGHCERPELFSVNPIEPGAVIYRTPIDHDARSILYSYSEDINEEDMGILIKIFDSVYAKWLAPIYSQHPEAIYTLNAMSDKYIILRHDTIQAFRFGELLTIMKA